MSVLKRLVLRLDYGAYCSSNQNSRKVRVRKVKEHVLAFAIRYSFDSWLKAAVLLKTCLALDLPAPAHTDVVLLPARANDTLVTIMAAVPLILCAWLEIEMRPQLPLLPFVFVFRVRNHRWKTICLIKIMYLH